MLNLRRYDSLPLKMQLNILAAAPKLKVRKVPTANDHLLNPLQKDEVVINACFKNVNAIDGFKGRKFITIIHANGQKSKLETVYFVPATIG